MAIWSGGGRLNKSLADEQMRRPLSIALASLLIAALVASTAQAATRRYDFQDFHGASPGQFAIHFAVFYKNKQRHGRYTPRFAVYDSIVPISCNPPVGAEATVPSGSYNSYIKLTQGSFNYSYRSEIPVSSGVPGSIGATVTGAVNKKQRRGQRLRVEGALSIVFYNLPQLGYHDCTSGGPIPFSAKPCRPFGSHPPPYIKPSLPVCFGGP